MKKIKSNTVGDMYHVVIRRINILKMTVLSSDIYRFSAILMAFFTELEKKIFLVCLEIQDPK